MCAGNKVAQGQPSSWLTTEAQLFDLTVVYIYIKLQEMKREKSANSLPYLYF